MDLNERKQKILKAIVDEYIGTAEPVGSRAISKKNELGLSSATIRNEMADLEEMGYLMQPHASAGRVPSDDGYRFYVNSLLSHYQVSMEGIAHIQRILEDKVNQLDSIIKKAKDRATFSDIVYSRNPYGFYADFFNMPEKYPDIKQYEKCPTKGNYVKIYGVKGKKGGAKRVTAYIEKEKVEGLS